MFEEHTLTDLLASFFYEKGYVSIPKLGTLRLEHGADPAPANHREAPRGAVSFDYRPDEPEDPDLVDFITERTRKMRALAVSDLLSLSDQAREMLNMGQSFTLRSLATLVPNGKGGFTVDPDKSPFHLSVKGKDPPAFNTARKPPVREGRIHSSGSRRTASGVLMTTICVCLGALLMYFLFFHTQPSPTTKGIEGSGPVSPTGDTPVASGHSIPASDGMLHYDAIFERAKGDRALARYRKLTAWGHPILLQTTDSIHFQLAIRFRTPARDTSAVKDSISRLYGHPVDIRLLP